MSLATQRQHHYRAAASSISTGVLIGIVAVIALAVLFVHLANEVVENEFFQFDRTVSLDVHSTASPLQTDIVRILTNFGSPYLVVLAILSLIIGSIIVWRSQHHKRAGMMVAFLDVFAPTFALGVAVLLAEVVKLIVSRPRPDGIFFPPIVTEPGPSFPSGHVLASVAFYGMSAYLLARPARPWLKAVITLVALAIIGLIAYTRIYLGVHFPTDVLGSMLIGSAWLITLIIALQITENHLKGAHVLGQAEQAQQQPAPESSLAPTIPTSALSTTTTADNTTPISD